MMSRCQILQDELDVLRESEPGFALGCLSVLFWLEFGLSLVQNSQSCICFVNDSDPKAHATTSLKTTTPGSFSSADIESLKRSNMILKVPSSSQPMPLKPLLPTHTHNPSKAESQRNAEMLERSRATLAEERARCEAVLMQLANFEAEKAKMQQEINGWALPFLRVCFLFCTFASCSFATRPWGRHACFELLCRFAFASRRLGDLRQRFGRQSFIS
jgi:hypothetical protein